MLKQLLIISYVVLLAACTPTTSEVSGEFKVPKGLEDCKIYKMRDSSGKPIYVVRCPNSNTSATLIQKHNVTAAVIDNGTWL